MLQAETTSIAHIQHDRAATGAQLTAAETAAAPGQEVVAAAWVVEAAACVAVVAEAAVEGEAAAGAKTHE